MFTVETAPDTSDVGTSLFGQQAGVIVAPTTAWKLPSSTDNEELFPKTAKQAPWLLFRAVTVERDEKGDSQAAASAEPDKEQRARLQKLKKPLFPHLSQSCESWAESAGTFMRNRSVYAPSHFTLIPSLTITDNITYVQHRDTKTVAKATKDTLERRKEKTSLRYQKDAKYSHGQRVTA